MVQPLPQSKRRLWRQVGIKSQTSTDWFCARVELRELQRGRFYLDNRMFKKEGFDAAIVKGWGDIDAQISLMDRISSCRK